MPKTYDVEPERCVECLDSEPMDLVPVDVDGASAHAWVCWVCGWAHVKSTEAVAS